ncbi:uroporphyrinogen-III C-methyltransferase [Alicyclobacillus suci]|uniref:uroporphyrinogen-III C-methyltransferase n=1 Tax=Alicyclobacillus suci TaxID=2816080 RepID=UPI002E29344F|nr:uroporphyrinogen-III C-methyltransferase [Alicyclobacillus suci]
MTARQFVGRVYLIGAGPGDPGLLTLNGKAALEAADVVVYDRLVAEELLDFARPGAQLIYVGKAPHHHTLAQRDIDALLVEKAQAGHTVARLKGGDPFIFGRGAEEAEALRNHGIPYEIVPGVSSVVAAPAYAGIPLTHRAIASGFHVVTGHECLHSTGTPWAAIAASNQTLVILMGMGHLRDIARRLIAHGRPAHTPTAVVHMGTTDQQVTVVGALADIADRVEARGLTSPAVIIVGDVVQLHAQLDWFRPQSAVQSELAR